MKTIEEVVNKSFPTFLKNTTITVSINRVQITKQNVFKEAVKFSERWISIDNKPENNQKILVKLKDLELCGIYKEDMENVLVLAFSKEKQEYLSFKMFQSWRPLNHI